MDPKEFGSYLKSLRVSKGLTLTQLGELTGYSNPYLSQIETGKKGIPSPELLSKLTKPLGVGYVHLMYKAGYLPDENYSHIEHLELINWENPKYMDEERKNNNLVNIILNNEIHLNGHSLSKDDRYRIVEMLNILFPDIEKQR